MAELIEKQDEDEAVDQANAPRRSGSHALRKSYAQLGLEQGAPMRDIETAYWRFARELRGQGAIAPYTEAYEALVNSVKPKAIDAGPTPAGPAETKRRFMPNSSSAGSKFGWPKA